MRLRTCIKFIFILMVMSGVCLSDDIPFISMAGDCRYPAVASEANNVYIVWVAAEGRLAKLYFRRSMDEGDTWSRSRMICNENSECYPPAIAVNSGIVHVSWIDFGETIDGEIYYARSINGGDSWEKNHIIVKDANNARYPLIICKENDVCLIWQDVENKIFFKASHNKGQTWENEILLGNVGQHSCYCFPPAMTWNGNEIVVVWSDFRQDRKGFKVSAFGLPLYKSSDKMVSSVVVRTSSDKGRTWSKEKSLSSTKVAKETTDEIDNPMILSDGTLSHLFWLDKRNLPLGEIFYAAFDPKTVKAPLTGKNLYPAQKRSPKRPSVVFDKEKNIHFTWASFFSGKSIIHYGTINRAGNTLKERMDLTSTIGRYHSPIITRTSSGLMHILWFDEPKDTDQWSRIFLKTSRDNGLTWKDWEPPKKDM